MRRGSEGQTHTYTWLYRHALPDTPEHSFGPVRTASEAIRPEDRTGLESQCRLLPLCSPQAGPNLEGLQGRTPQDLGQERPNRPRLVPEHLSDIAESQVDDLECIVSGTAKQMELVMAEAQGGDPALYRDDLDTVGAPEEVGIERDEEDAS